MQMAGFAESALGGAAPVCWARVPDPVCRSTASDGPAVVYQGQQPPLPIGRPAHHDPQADPVHPQVTGLETRIVKLDVIGIGEDVAEVVRAVALPQLPVGRDLGCFGEVGDIELSAEAVSW